MLIKNNKILMKKNEIYFECEDCIKFLNKLPDNCIDLIVIDPPYYKTIGEKWDNKWKNEKEYIEFIEKCIVESCRTLKQTGSFYIFGDLNNDVFLTTAFIVKKYFIRKNIIIWCKNKALTNIKNNFVKDTEAIIYCTKTNNFIFNGQRGNYSMQGYLRYKKSDLDKDGIIRNIDLKFSGENYAYNQIKKRLGKKFNDNDIFMDINVGLQICKNYFIDIPSMHEKGFNKLKKKFSIVVKPIKLIERLILTSSNKNDLVLDCFLGSGTTAVACKNLNRKFIGCDDDEDYVKLVGERINL